MVFNSSQLDDPPHHFLLCTRMVRILLLACPITLLIVTQQADNSHRPNIILSHRYRDNPSPRRIQINRWRPYRSDLWQFHQQRHDRGSELSARAGFHPRIYYNKQYYRTNYGTRYQTAFISIQESPDDLPNSTTETCLAETIRDHAITFLSCDVSNVDRTHYQPYLRIRAS